MGPLSGGTALSVVCGPGVGWEVVAASSSRSDGSMPAGENVGIDGSVAWSDIMPSSRGTSPTEGKERGNNWNAPGKAWNVRQRTGGQLARSSTVGPVWPHVFPHT